MKRNFPIIIDFILIASGILVSIVGAIKWKSVDYNWVPFGPASSFDGRLYFYFILAGVAMVIYALFDFWVFRRTRDSDKK